MKPKNKPCCDCPLHPARHAAARLRRARVTAHSRSATGPSDMELHPWLSRTQKEEKEEIKLEFYAAKPYEREKLTGWF